MNARPPISAEEALEHTEWVGRLARALVDDREEAADLAQDAWEAALDTSEPPKSELRAWLTGVLRNLSAMRARTHVRRTRREAAAESPQPTLPPDERGRDERRVAQAGSARRGVWLLSVLVAFFFTRADPTDDEPPG